MPKISVLIPLYNRKHYIEDCVNSVLNQTFQDFEIIIRDDGSSDASADFVQERYAAEISSGKIKLRRNEKNCTQYPTVNRLIRAATGKYIMILHSDDLYLPQALEQMHAVAEQFNADVVHGCRFLNSPPGGVIEDGTTLAMTCWERNPVDEVTLMPDDKFSRFMEWAIDGTFLDSQYNFYRREFIQEKNLFFDKGKLVVFLLRWLLNAKIYVKVPFIPYIRRDAPDSITNDIKKFSLEEFITNKIEVARSLEDLVPEINLFSDNAEIRKFIFTKFLISYHQFCVARRGIYKDGVTDEIYEQVESTFRKHIGDTAPYVALLFNALFMIPTNQNLEQIILSDALKRVIDSTISPLPQR